MIKEQGSPEPITFDSLLDTYGPPPEGVAPSTLLIARASSTELESARRAAFTETSLAGVEVEKAQYRLELAQSSAGIANEFYTRNVPDLQKAIREHKENAAEAGKIRPILPAGMRESFASDETRKGFVGAVKRFSAETGKTGADLAAAQQRMDSATAEYTETLPATELGKAVLRERKRLGLRARVGLFLASAALAGGGFGLAYAESGDHPKQKPEITTGIITSVIMGGIIGAGVDRTFGRQVSQYAARRRAQKIVARAEAA